MEENQTTTATTATTTTETKKPNKFLEFIKATGKKIYTVIKPVLSYIVTGLTVIGGFIIMNAIKNHDNKVTEVAKEKVKESDDKNESLKNQESINTSILNQTKDNNIQKANDLNTNITPSDKTSQDRLDSLKNEGMVTIKPKV